MLATRVLPVILLLAFAPLQCTKKADPSMRQDDAADDGLWALAEDFKAKGNHDAYVSTLRFLLTRYPNSRHAGDAKEEVDGPGQTTAPAPATGSAGAKTE